MSTGHASDRDLTLKLKEYTDGESLEKFEIQTRICIYGSVCIIQITMADIVFQRCAINSRRFHSYIKVNRPQIRGYRCLPSRFLDGNRSTSKKITSPGVGERLRLYHAAVYVTAVAQHVPGPALPHVVLIFCVDFVQWRLLVNERVTIDTLVHNWTIFCFETVR